jgi:hypothetical protein
MSDNGTSPDPAEALKAQLETLTQELAGLVAAQNRARRVRMVLLLVAIAFVVVVVGSFYQKANAMIQQDNIDRVVKAAETRLQKRSDDYLRQVQMLADNTRPAVTEAFSRQVKKDLPQYLRDVEKERDILSESLQKKLSTTLSKQYEQALVRNEQVLKKEFPLVKDEEMHARMMANLQIALKQILKKYYVDELQQQIHQLYATWDHFPAADKPGKGEPSLEEQLIGELVRLLEIKLTNRDRYVSR